MTWDLIVTLQCVCDLITGPVPLVLVVWATVEWVIS
jgi:hypothetical protein